MNTYTRGPWLVDNTLVYALGPSDTNSFSASFQTRGEDRVSDTELIAIARLAAAAPDLLVALQDLLLDMLMGEGDLIKVDAVAKASAAIAKATGLKS